MHYLFFDHLSFSHLKQVLLLGILIWTKKKDSLILFNLFMHWRQFYKKNIRMQVFLFRSRLPNSSIIVSTRLNFIRSTTSLNNKLWIDWMREWTESMKKLSIIPTSSQENSQKLGTVEKRIVTSNDWRTDGLTNGRKVGPIFKQYLDGLIFSISWHFINWGKFLTKWQCSNIFLHNLKLRIFLDNSIMEPSQ